MCNWILRVEAEHRKCNRAGVRLPGAKEAETVGCDKEGAYRSAGQRMHAILHNESILGGHQERVENCRDPEERRDEDLACTKRPCRRSRGKKATTRGVIDDSKVEAKGSR